MIVKTFVLLCSISTISLCYAKETWVNDQRICQSEGYLLNSNLEGCYKLYNEGRSWSVANSVCVSEGAHLAVVNSEQEAMDLKDLLYAQNVPHIFIGIRDWRDGKSWQTVQGQSLSEAGYARWHSGEPNTASRDEYCGTLWRSGFFADDSCSTRIAFVCEKEIF